MPWGRAAAVAPHAVLAELVMHARHLNGVEEGPRDEPRAERVAVEPAMHPLRHWSSMVRAATARPARTPDQMTAPITTWCRSSTHVRASSPFAPADMPLLSR